MSQRQYPASSLSGPPPSSSPAPSPSGPPAELRVHGESLYDQVSSLLMAVVVGAALSTGWLALVYATQQAYASRVAAPVEIIEVFGGGGGVPDGELGAIEEIDIPGAEAAEMASNLEEAMLTEFEEPAVEEVPAVLLDAFEEASELMVDLEAPVLTGTVVRSGPRASKLGTGGPGYGFGPGDGGVPREQRWSIIYNPGQTLEEYARQLDFIGVELATPISNEQLRYASRFASATPQTRTGSPQGDHRLFFLWQGGGRKATDVALLQRADIQVGDRPIFQFYPPAIEERLAQLEVSFKGLQPAEIRTTRFRVVPRDNGYDFVVVAQEPLR